MPPIDVKMMQIMLLSAVVILGVYILIINSIAYVQENSIADYHIGCFLYDETHHQFNHFKHRLLKLKKNAQSNKRYDLKIRGSDLIDPNLHKRSVQLAKGVQNFIQRLIITKGYQQSNMEFFAELSRARVSYEQCANSIRSEFDTEECNNLWSEYNKCFSQYNSQKQELNKLYNNRKNVSRQIDSLLLYDPTKSSNINIEQQLLRLKQKYNTQSKQNDKLKQKATIELKRLQSRHQSSSIDYEQSLRQVNRAKTDYQMCKRNLKQFRKCQDITKALEQYGYSESIENLERRMNTKRENLIKMRQLLLQSKTGRFNDNQQIKIMYDKREDQFKKLIKLRLDMSWDQMKECGCKEQDKIRLQSEYQKAKIKNTQLSISLNEISLLITRFESQIKQADKSRQTLLNEYREDTEALANRDVTIPDLNDKLNLLKTDMDKINNQISGFNRKLNSIEFQCNQYKDQLANRVFKTDQVTRCLAKKDFYEKLAGKAKLILHDEDFSMKEDKKYIVQILKNIKYPRQLLLLQIQNQVQPQKPQEIVEQKEIFISITQTVKTMEHEL